MTLKIGTSAGGSQVDSQPLTGTNGTTGPNTVATGTYYVSESFDAPTNGADYTSALSCFNDLNNTWTTTAAGGDGGRQRQRFRHLGRACRLHLHEPRKTGQIQLKKDWVGTAGSVSLEVKQGATVKASGTANGADGQTNNATVDTGSYTLNETFTAGVQADYASTVTCVDDAAGHTNAGLPNGDPFTAGTPQSVSVDANDEIVCTITNKRLPQLKVVKDLLPAADTGRFDLKIDATTYTNAGAGYGDGGNTGFVNVTAASHTVDEAGHAGTGLADYDKSVSCDSGKGGNTAGPSHTLTAAYGEQITCTITNKRLPQLKVVKDLLPAADTGRFDLKIDATTYTNAGAGYGDGGTRAS